MKKCSKCLEEKDESFFSKNKTTNDGFQHHCKECQKQRYLREKVKILEQCRSRYLANVDGKKEYDKKRRAEKIEQIREYDRKRNKLEHRRKKSLDWQKNNKESRRLIAAKSRKKHWESTYNRLEITFKKNASKRRAELVNATPSWFDEFDDFVLTEAYNLSSIRFKTTGFKWDVDHVVPIKGKSVCGFHLGINIQVIPQSVNRWKSNKLLESPTPHFQRTV